MISIDDERGIREEIHDTARLLNHAAYRMVSRDEFEKHARLMLYAINLPGNLGMVMQWYDKAQKRRRQLAAAAWSRHKLVAPMVVKPKRIFKKAR